MNINLPIFYVIFLEVRVIIASVRFITFSAFRVNEHHADMLHFSIEKFNYFGSLI